MRITLRHISDRLGVSIATVSRALVDDPAIAVNTRQRVAEAAAELGYRPNRAARALVTGRTRVIGLHLSRLSGWYTAIALRLQRLAEADGYAAVLTTGGRADAHWTTDGDIGIGVVPDHLLDGPRQPRARRAVVSIDQHPAVDSVWVDLLAPSRAAVARLLDDGRRRVAKILPGAAPSADADVIARCGPRERAYVEAMRAARRRCEFIATGECSRAGARDAVLAHARAHGLPDALFCHNDDVAIGAYRACVELGARVPDDVALIGCDGIEDVEFLEKPLSTIVQPLDETARTAWRFLRRRIDEPAAPAQRRALDARLVLRASTAR